MSRTRKRKPYNNYAIDERPYRTESKVDSSFKRDNRREERSKQNQALRENREIPVIKNRDMYEYW